jgi:DNA segregation ATPase FtsK/SpoIIIE-like protein
VNDGPPEGMNAGGRSIPAGAKNSADVEKVDTGQASISMIQRRLRIGYNRSARSPKLGAREHYRARIPCGGAVPTPDANRAAAADPTEGQGVRVARCTVS